jgi:predicted lipoprotein with Yx(FWY)xxD motif
MRRLLPVLALALVVTAAATAAAAPRAKVAVRSTSLGRVLVDARGRTLYAFDLDTHGKPSCTGGCATLWLPLLTTGSPLSAGVPAAKLGTVKRGDGRLQVMFAGHPLYRFAKDAHAGQVAGASVAHWAALAVTGAKVRATGSGGAVAPPTSTTPPISGGGGDDYGGYGP